MTLAYSGYPLSATLVFTLNRVDLAIGTLVFVSGRFSVVNPINRFTSLHKTYKTAFSSLRKVVLRKVFCRSDYACSHYC